jgi:hypothetical protein
MAIIPMEEIVIINITPDEEQETEIEENECNICLDVIENNELIENICSCINVKYHKKCIKRWIETKSGSNITCEICKSEYRGITIKQIGFLLNLSIKAKIISTIFSSIYVGLMIYLMVISSCRGCEAPIGFFIFWTLPYYFVTVASIVDRKMYIHTMCMMMTTNMNQNSYIRNVIVFDGDVEEGQRRM